MTPRDLIKSSLRLFGAIATGETPSSDQETDAFSVLNEMLVSWSNDGLLIPQIVRESFALTPNQQTYTMGPSGNFNTTRPVRIESAGVEMQNGASTVEFPLRILNSSQWAEIGLKSTASTLPSRIYPDESYPLMNINLWPVPSAANNLILYSAKPFSSFSTVTDNVIFPPGYSRALRYNLAFEIAPEYGKELSESSASIAVKSLADIKRKNIKPVYMKSDVSGIGSHGRSRFNIWKGE